MTRTHSIGPSPTSRAHNKLVVVGGGVDTCQKHSHNNATVRRVTHVCPVAGSDCRDQLSGRGPSSLATGSAGPWERAGVRPASANNRQGAEVEGGVGVGWGGGEVAENLHAEVTERSSDSHFSKSRTQAHAS